MQWNVAQMTVTVQHIANCAIKILPNPVVSLITFQCPNGMVATLYEILALTPLKLPK